MNDGEGKFTISQVYPNVPYKGEATLFADFDEDNLIEYITFYDSKNNDKTESTVGFYLYEMTAEIGTGPNYSTDTAEQGAPGFNETYYLDKNTSAQEALTAGTYATGLEHYLAEGKDAELKTFAPLQKFMDIQEMILLFFVKAMKLLMVMLEKTLLKVVLVTILLMVAQV